VGLWLKKQHKPSWFPFPGKKYYVDVPFKYVDGFCEGVKHLKHEEKAGKIYFHYLLKIQKYNFNFGV
jgi:hypothetical protein